jgi:hypothetical protein
VPEVVQPDVVNMAVALHKRRMLQLLLLLLLSLQLLLCMLRTVHHWKGKVQQLLRRLCL